MLLQPEVAGKRADREYERLLKLKEVGLVTQQSLDDGQTEKEGRGSPYRGARAQLKAAEEDFQHTQTRLSKTTIRVPRGRGCLVVEWNVGDMVGEMASQKIMFKIIDTRILELTVTVPSLRNGGCRWASPSPFRRMPFPGKSLPER